MSSLYHLTQDYIMLETEILNLEELPEDKQGQAESDLTKRFFELSDDIRTKLDSCAAMVSQWEAQEKAAKEEVKRLNERAKTFAARATWMKQRMHEALKAAGEKKVECERFTVSLRKGSERVVCNDATADLPEHLLRYKDPDPDKTAIKAALKGGEELTGWAIERGPDSLSIR